MRRIHPLQLGDMVGTGKRFYHEGCLCWDARKTDGSNVVFKYKAFGGRTEEAYLYTEEPVSLVEGDENEHHSCSDSSS